MRVDEFVVTYPRLYNMAEIGAWSSIERHGLLSTTAILDLCGSTPTERSALERSIRTRSTTVSHPDGGFFVLRDQKPLNAKKLAACDRVKVLVTSRELETRYGEAPVAVTFPAGKGEVVHMISHYYLQRTELRTARHRTPAAAYATSKGVAWGADLNDLTTGDVEAAGSSARMLSNYIAQKKRRSENR